MSQASLIPRPLPTLVLDCWELSGNEVTTQSYLSSCDHSHVGHTIN